MITAANASFTSPVKEIIRILKTEIKYLLKLAWLEGKSPLVSQASHLSYVTLCNDLNILTFVSDYKTFDIEVLVVSLFPSSEA